MRSQSRYSPAVWNLLRLKLQPDGQPKPGGCPTLEVECARCEMWRGGRCVEAVYAGMYCYSRPKEDPQLAISPQGLSTATDPWRELDVRVPTGYQSRSRARTS